MLDTETKARIDSARDILVGKVPDPKSQVEQITIALIYKFMDDMDRQSEELGGKATFFAGGFKKYRWAQLLDKRYGGHERLLLYAEGIEKMNENKNIPLGIRTMKTGAEGLGLPLPRYMWDDPYLVLTLYRSPQAAVQAMGRETLESLSEGERKGWQWIAAREVVTLRSYSEAMGIPNRTALNHLNRFTRIGLLSRSGTGPATRYEVRLPSRK